MTQIVEAHQEHVNQDTANVSPARRGAIRRLTSDQLRHLHSMLLQGPESCNFNGTQWQRVMVKSLIERTFGVSYHLNYIPKVLKQIPSALFDAVGETPYFASSRVTLYRGDAATVLGLLPPASVDCIVTSPPYYGQRDYGVAEQIGLEDQPQEYINHLLAVFHEAKRVLKPTGSLWVNLGDTYWSGKGKPTSPDLKQKHRRFLRPQDRSGPRPLCTPKQLLLIPHRFAIAMQDDGWIVRNDNVWYKVNPTPDPVYDRCASAHEYMFHFVLNKKYYYNHEAVAVPSQGIRETKAPSSVWEIQLPPNFKKHIAVFPEALVKIPILGTLPPQGVLLDPFCGSCTALSYAITQGGAGRAIGIDISEVALEEAARMLNEA